MEQQNSNSIYREKKKSQTLFSRSLQISSTCWIWNLNSNYKFDTTDRHMKREQNGWNYQLKCRTRNFVRFDFFQGSNNWFMIFTKTKTIRNHWKPRIIIQNHRKTLSLIQNQTNTREFDWFFSDFNQLLLSPDFLRRLTAIYCSKTTYCF